MQRKLQLRVTPEQAGEPHLLQRVVAQELSVSVEEIQHIHHLKRSIDARQKNVKINLTVEVFLQEEQVELPAYTFDIQPVNNKPHVLIIGAGPAGMFAALEMIQHGFKPILLDRGKDARGRLADLANINKKHEVNPDSNYCFGEGGAGTYSDGKLYTRSKKRGDVRTVLEWLVAHGADEDILVNAHPHIGTNKLPKIIMAIRQRILEAGGEVHFETKMKDLRLKDGKVTGIETADGRIFEGDQLILATGHSARDVFELLHNRGIRIEAKPFALGVRIEHQQSLIDQIQYHCEDRGPYLPAASYSLVDQVQNRGVYSFCMCPGGVIAPCATSPGEVVTNGWSPSKRNHPTSNSGIVVELKPEDFKGFEQYGPLAGMHFQAMVEKTAWEAAGESQRVPAQRMVDFIQHKHSADLPKTSYIPGLTSVQLQDVLPTFVYKTLRQGFLSFGKKMKGYLTNDAIIHAPESRTSSPVKIPRDPETLEHPEVAGLYPCGEGAGYAGGIVSAAIDGMRCARAAMLKLK